MVLLTFHQVLSPVADSALLTTLIALGPVVVLLFLLAVLRITAWLSALIGSAVTFLLAVLVWQAPLADAGKVYLLVGERIREARVPVAQLVLMWVSANMPGLADRILASARTHYLAVAPTSR